MKTYCDLGENILRFERKLDVGEKELYDERDVPGECGSRGAQGDGAAIAEIDGGDDRGVVQEEAVYGERGGLQERDGRVERACGQGTVWERGCS